MVFNDASIKATNSSVAAQKIENSEIYIGISIDDHERILKERFQEIQSDLDQIKEGEAEKRFRLNIELEVTRSKLNDP